MHGESGGIELLLAKSGGIRRADALFKLSMWRERAGVVAGLALLTGLSWAYLYHDATAGYCARMHHAGTLTDFLMLFIMWTVMMAAMMAPSAAPMILTFAALNRKRMSTGAPLYPAGAFAGAYLAVWAAFSLAATGVQWWLHSAAMLSMSMELTDTRAAAGLLVLAGLFQWTPLKRACLDTCHAPFAFLMTHWRDGRWGALRMGIQHGVYCVGCCWAVMGLLFVAGVMNLPWVLILSLFVLAEKLSPKLARPAGTLMAVAGIAMMLMQQQG